MGHWQAAGFARIAVVVGHVLLALLFDKYTLTGAQLHRAGHVLLQDRLQ
jgi:hypothetical protein